MVKLIVDSGADFVALQQSDEERSPRLAAACGYESKWFEDGVAFLVKKEPLDNVWSNSFNIRTAKSWDELQPTRKASVLAIKLVRLNLTVLVTQFEVWKVADPKRQESQVKSLLNPSRSQEWVRSKHRIIVGDLDLEPSSPLIEKVRNDQLKEAFDDQHDEKKKKDTYPAEDPKKKVDYVFYNPEICKVVSSRVIREPICCDHLPLLVEFVKLKVGLIGFCCLSRKGGDC